MRTTNPTSNDKMGTFYSQLYPPYVIIDTNFMSGFNLFSSHISYMNRKSFNQYSGFLLTNYADCILSKTAR